MPYGPRYGRMAQPATEEELAVERRKERKLKLIEEAVKEHELSWVIKTRHSEERWRILAYDLTYRDGMPGALFITDRDTDMDVKIYAPGMWFDVDTVIPLGEDDTVNWKPQKAYLEDLADRLITEEERKACEYDWCSKPLGHMPPHARKDGKRILNDGPQA